RGRLNGASLSSATEPEMRSSVSCAKLLGVDPEAGRDPAASCIADTRCAFGGSMILLRLLPVLWGLGVDM
ncbi:hypothetical protein LPJ66_011823, partial [Kickxella alabastrina]